jgi:hypothetical protein
MSTTKFFFTTAFGQELISVGGPMIGSIQTLAAAILVTLFLLNIYETFARGGGLRGLLVSAVKYSACALIIEFWPKFFPDFASSFVDVATSISSTDFASVFSANCMNMVNGFDPSHWTDILSSGGIVPLIGEFLWLVIVVLYYVWMLIFSIIYTAWGLILYGLGPLLIALYPSNATSSFAKHYLKSMAEWAAWPVLYAILGALAAGTSLPTKPDLSTFVGTTTVRAFASNAVLAPIWNLLQNVIMACIFICFMAVIPFIASHLINGEFASTAMATGKALANMASGGATAAAGAGAIAAGAKVAKAAAAGGASAGQAVAMGAEGAKASWAASHSKGGGKGGPPDSPNKAAAKAIMKSQGEAAVGEGSKAQAKFDKGGYTAPPPPVTPEK